MKTRELYKQKYEAQLHEWSAKVDALGAQTEKLTAEAKLKAKPHLDGVKSKLEEAKEKLHEMAAASDDKWDDVKTSADRAWEDTKAAIEGAYDALTAESKKKKQN